MGAPRDLDLKYRIALKAIGIGPKDKIYKAMQTFLPIINLATIKEVTLSCASEKEYLEALDALMISSHERHSGGILKQNVKIEFEDVVIRVELARSKKETSTWKNISSK